MPLPFAVAAPAVASTVGSAFSYFGGKGAQKTQQRAADQALAFEQEREATRRREYEEQQEQAKRQWEAEQQFRVPYRNAAVSVLAGYGFKIPTNFAEVPPEEPMQPPPMTLGSMGRPRSPYGQEF